MARGSLPAPLQSRVAALEAALAAALGASAAADDDTRVTLAAAAGASLAAQGAVTEAQQATAQAQQAAQQAQQASTAAMSAQQLSEAVSAATAAAIAQYAQAVTDSASDRAALHVFDAGLTAQLRALADRMSVEESELVQAAVLTTPAAIAVGGTWDSEVTWPRPFPTANYAAIGGAVVSGAQLGKVQVAVLSTPAPTAQRCTVRTASAGLLLTAGLRVVVVAVSAG